jgi:transcriptional regulator with XRE-family HTH domain
MIIRKLRLQRGWTQEQLAEMSGVSVRSIQRVERGQNCSLESLKCLAAVFEVDLSALQTGGETMNKETLLSEDEKKAGGETMNKETLLSEDEKKAIEFVKGIKEFYTHLFMFLFFTVIFCGIFSLTFGFNAPAIRWMYYSFIGWGVGVILHGLNAYELINLFGPKWEKKMIEKRLGKKL